MSERRGPVEVRRGDLRVGDILNPNSTYTGDDETLGAVCESVSRDKGQYIRVTWRVVATGEERTNSFHEDDRVILMRRGPGATPRDHLWDQLRLDPRQINRETFEQYMDAYDKAASAGPVRPDEETTP